MSFREKSAWITLVCLLLTFGHFFLGLWGGAIPERGMVALHWFLMSVVGFVILQVILHVIAAILAPKDAKAPVDERERLIRLKASRNAHVVLIIGALAVPLSMHLGHHGPDIAYIAMLALFVSEVVRAISQIVYYRLGR